MSNIYCLIAVLITHCGIFYGEGGADMQKLINFITRCPTYLVNE